MQSGQDSFDQPVLSPQIATLTLTILEELRVSREEVFDRLDFPEDILLSENAALSFHQMFALIDAALRLSPIPWLGLKVGAAETVGTWGVLGYALMSSATEQEASKIGAKYYQAAPSFMHIDPCIEGDRQKLRLDAIYPNQRLIPFCVEENIVSICKVSSEYLQKPVRPLEVSLTYSKPVYAKKYDEYFDCPILYNQPANLLWTRAPENRPLRTADPASADICLKLAENLVEKYRGEDGFILSLRRLLLQNPGNMPDMEDISVELAMSSRTLRRKLTERETSFKKLQEDVRKNLALDYLENTHLSIDQIAHRLGYSETTNFRRAFKQWLGEPPSHFRAVSNRP